MKFYSMTLRIGFHPTQCACAHMSNRLIGVTSTAIVVSVSHWSLSKLSTDTRRKLLRSITQCQSHVLRHLLKEKPTPVRFLRARSHNFILPPKENKSFISRALYHAVCPPPTE